METPELATPHPGPRSQEFLAMTRAHESPGDTTFALSPEPVVEHQGEGAWIIDPDGNRYLDFMAGFGPAITGHCHPKVVAAIREQAGRLLHIMGAVNPVHARLAQRVVELAPGDFPKKVQFGNSGAEAVEIALKLARYKTRRQEIIAFHGAFHGRTSGALALTAKRYARQGLYPMASGVVHLPYAYCYRCPFGKSYPSCDLQCARFVQETVEGPATGVTEPAAIIVEPILGNGGIVVPPPEYVPALREICDRNGMLLIADEVMSGWGRTGKLFAMEASGVAPDILVTAKGIASGLPLSATIARAELTDVWTKAREGSTFSGNPVSCAAALATLDVLHEEQLVSRAAATGEYLLARLRELATRFPVVGDVRGRGLMVGIELVQDRTSKAPIVGGAQRATDLAVREGLLLYAGGHYENVLSFLPPLIIEREHVDVAMEILGRVLTKLEA
jgi:4-aminobutyrate aminotransferase